MLTNIRFEQENDALAHELIITKVSLRSKLDEVGLRSAYFSKDIAVLFISFACSCSGFV